MAADLKEEDMVNKYLEDEINKQNGAEHLHNGNSMTQKEIDTEFDNLDINDYNK